MKGIKIQKVIALLLSIIMILSSSFTVFANGTVGGANGGDVSTGAGGSGNSNSDMNWRYFHQGYRFYIINQDFIRVSPIYDFCFVAPTNIGEWCRFPC